MSRGYVDPNWPPTDGPNDAPIIIYGYTPSVVVAILGIVLFLLSTVVHGFQLYKRKTWYFTPVLVGAIMEIVGYAFRLLSSKKSPYNVIYFVVQYFFIVVAPVFFSAAIYTVLSVLIQTHPHTKSFSPLPPKLILWLFIVCDVIATIVQIAGAALIGKAESNREDPTTANNILLAGLAFQCFSFALFIILLVLYLWRVRRARAVHSGTGFSASDKTEAGVNAMAHHSTANGSLLHLKPGFIPAFAAATILIYIRTCFRLAETAEGLYGYLSTHEVIFGCLEFAPVVLAVGLFNAWHPGRCILNGDKL